MIVEVYCSYVFGWPDDNFSPAGMMIIRGKSEVEQFPKIMDALLLREHDLKKKDSFLILKNNTNDPING